MDNFTGADRSNFDKSGLIEEKVLKVAIPKGASKEQVKQIKKAVEYAKEKGIKVDVKKVN